MKFEQQPNSRDLLNRQFELSFRRPPQKRLPNRPLLPRFLHQLRHGPAAQPLQLSRSGVVRLHGSAFRLLYCTASHGIRKPRRSTWKA